jgi:hypothetical protein
MNTPIPFPDRALLDCLLLTAASYPSGLSYSLFTQRGGDPRQASASFLGFLVAAYVVIVAGVLVLRPGLLLFHGTSPLWLMLAGVLAPVALLLEFCLNAYLAYRHSGVFPRGVDLHQFWDPKTPLSQHLLLGLIVVGEECLYRGVWIGALHGSLGVPAPVALGISAVAYGCNHLAFGTKSVLSKTVMGLVYGGLYLAGGQSLWLPIMTHGLQNLLLFALARRSYA